MSLAVSIFSRFFGKASNGSLAPYLLRSITEPAVEHHMDFIRMSSKIENNRIKSGWIEFDCIRLVPLVRKSNSQKVRRSIVDCRTQ